MTSPPVKALLDLHTFTKTIMTTTTKIKGTINMNKKSGPMKSKMLKKSKNCICISPIYSLSAFNRREYRLLITFTRDGTEMMRSEQINAEQFLLAVETSTLEEENYADSIILIEEALCQRIS